MKKEIFAITACVAILISTSSCGRAPKEDVGANGTIQTESETPSTAEPKNNDVVVDEGILTVDIKIPQSFFNGIDMSTFDPEDYAKEQGFIKAVVNEDGSITSTMTKAKHKDILKDTALKYDKIFSEMVGSDATPYITKITRSDDFGKIDVEVDRASYDTEEIDMTPINLGMSGLFYQIFATEEPRVEVFMKYADNGEIISTSIYPDDMK